MVSHSNTREHAKPTGSQATSTIGLNSFVVSEMIAVLKANACGHGSVPVARHLYEHGVRHFAVATPHEGVVLRQAGLQGFIQIFGMAAKIYCF